jgi:glycosyltransferase involved in cell wall biosynthesis
LIENNLLSIFIPTFNRGHLIGETLDSFIEQISEYRIPIVISDNCSTDDTFQVVERYKQKYPYIKYSKNAENLGFDGNVVKMAELVDTKYCWLFGDDDIIKKDAITKVLNILKNDFDLIVANTSLSSIDLSVQFSYRHLAIDEDRLYDGNDTNKAFVDLVSYTSFIGGLIVKKELWKSVDYSKYMKTGFVHVGIAFEYLINNRNVYYISDPLTNIRLGNSGWSTNSFEVLYVLWDKAIKELPNYSDDIKRKVYANYREFSYLTYFVERAKGTFRYDQYNKFIKNDLIISKVKKIFLFLLLLFPVSILKYFWMFYLSYKKPYSYEYQVYLLKTSQLKKIEYL